MSATAVLDPVSRLAAPETLLAEMGEPLDPSRYDWSAARTDALTDEEVFQLTYAAQVEWGTEGTFASLNISRDPVVRRFLRVWLSVVSETASPENHKPLVAEDASAAPNRQVERRLLERP